MSLPVKYQAKSQTIITTTSRPGSQEFLMWGHTQQAILGNGGGKFARNYNYFPVKQKVITIDTSPGSLMTVAQEVPHLNVIITRGAELFSLAKFKHLDKNKKEIEDSPIIQFLEQPNVLQTLEQYLYEFYVNHSVYNKTFQHKILGLSFDLIPAGMWNLPSGWMQINTTDRMMYRQVDLQSIIEKYVLLGDVTAEFEPNRVIYMSQGVGSNPLYPISRIETLKMPLSNIVAALKSRNIIISERGMIGFLSPDQPSKSDDGYQPFDEDEAVRFRKEYQKKFSLDSRGGHVAMTTNSMKWVPMTFNIQELGLLEGVEGDFAICLDAWGLRRDIFSSVKGATYENQAQAEKSSIHSGIQPLANKLARQWERNFIDPKSGETLIADYSHVPSMKEDERLAAQGRLYNIQGLSTALRDGVISHDQYALKAELEPDGTKEFKDQPSVQNTNVSTKP